ncbi:Cdc23 domain-containing protein [Plasmodiophora brassicae]
MEVDDDATQEVVMDRIEAYADAFDYDGAVWWCERLFASAPTLPNLLRLVQVHLRAHRPARAYGILSTYQAAPDDPVALDRKRRFALATACFQLGKLTEAEKCLSETIPSYVAAASSIDAGHVPGGANGLYLLGRICLKQNRRTHALTYFARCVEVDRLHWSAYAQMCQMGAAHPNACRIDPVQPGQPREPIQQQQQPSLPSPAALGFRTPQSNPPRTSQFLSQMADEFEETPLSKPPPTRRSRASRLDCAITPGPPRPALVLPGSRTPRRSERLSFSSVADSTDQALGERVAGRGERLRRSTRQEKTQARAPGRPATARVAPGETPDRPLDMSEPFATATSLPQVVANATEGYRLLCAYQCQEAIDTFMRLPECHFNTSWVLAQVGRAYFELNKYQKSIDMFEAACRVDPCLTSGLEVYSTALWQLKREVQLSFLAQRAVECDRLSPSAWLAVGNCFSLQKEHDTALKFFQRAIQLDPSCAYAYTLSAHEYIANEDFDKAVAGFRNAIRIDEQHYNAWYGLGAIYYRQEKFDVAAYHFRRAIKINPRNSVLECYLGMVLHANKQYDEALHHLQRSCDLEPANLLPRFQKANVFFSMEDYDAAMEELQYLADVAPREASVHFLMGKISKKRGQLGGALMHFLTCLDLDPKDRNLVKSAIDKLHSSSPDLDDPSDDDEF